MPADSEQMAVNPPVARSRIGNGSALFLDTDGQSIDGRSLPARVFRDVLAEIVNDLGGRDMLSQAQWQLCRRAAALSVACMGMESEQAAGQAFPLEAYGGAADRLRRVLVTLGLKRRARDVTPTLGALLSQGGADG